MCVCAYAYMLLSACVCKQVCAGVLWCGCGWVDVLEGSSVVWASMSSSYVNLCSWVHVNYEMDGWVS